MRAVLLAVLVLAATNACGRESGPSSGFEAGGSAVAPLAPPEAGAGDGPPRVELSGGASAATPLAPPGGRAGDGSPRVEPPPGAGSDADAPVTAEDPFSDLAVAWYDKSAARHELVLLCESRASWIHYDVNSLEPCAPDGLGVYVIDPHGVGRWWVRARVRRGIRRDPMLVRPRARYPSASMPVLVTNKLPAAANARLAPPQFSPPSEQTRALARSVAIAAATAEQMDPINLPLTAVEEVHGVFGGDIDTIAVFEVDETAPAFVAYQVLAALSKGKVVSLNEGSLLEWGGHEVVGVTDLDGDGRQELLWWAGSEGGTSINITYVSGDKLRERNLFACECGEGFRSAYPRR